MIRYAWMATAVTFALAGCKKATSTVGPEHPGVGNVDSTTYEGAPFTPGADDLVFVHDGTGTRFNLVGQAFDGELADARVQLGVLPGMTAFWFAWTTHHPGARIWNVGTANEGHTIKGDDECGVPCEEIVSGCFGGKDCIPSIDSPSWVDGDSSPSYLDDDERVLGIAREGLARAYPLDTLWQHEIVNDTWGDWSFSVTYCPLTGSGILVDGTQGDQAMEFGVSGNLYNSNLIMYDRTTDSLYGQMRMISIAGERLGEPLAVAGLVDTTWAAWREMYPHTQVLGSRHAGSYPYGDYRTNEDTFMANTPSPDGRYHPKDYTIGVIGSDGAVLYPFPEIESQIGELAVFEDTIGDLPVLVAYDGRSQTGVVFSRLVNGEEQHFTLEGERTNE